MKSRRDWGGEGKKTYGWELAIARENPGRQRPGLAWHEINPPTRILELYCRVVTAITPAMLPVPYFVVASHERYNRIVATCDAGMLRKLLIGPNS